jgi:hypothetical protein
MTEIIGPTYVMQGNVESYQAMPDAAGLYKWIVQGGNILEGQGTQAIMVEWWMNGFGSIELDTTTVEGHIEGLFISINVRKKIHSNLLSVS